MDIYMETRERLLSLDCIEGIAIRMTQLGKSRIENTKWLNNFVQDHKGRIFDWDGIELDFSEDGPDYVEDAYGNDLACTWNSEVKRFAVVPPKRKPRQSLLLRLALWELAFRHNDMPIF